MEYLDGIEGDADHHLDQLLPNGAFDAVLSPNVLPSISARDPRTHRGFGDCRTEEQRYFKDTRIFPISHVVTLKRDFVEKYPHAPVALLEAYSRARDVAIDRIAGSDPVVLTISWAALNLAEQQELMGSVIGLTTLKTISFPWTRLKCRIFDLFVDPEREAVLVV